MRRGSHRTGKNAVSARTVIANERGLHARAAAKLVKLAETHCADITVTAGGQTVSGRSIMGLLMLGAVKGTEVTIGASGADAANAVSQIVRLIEDSFEEGADG